MNNENYKIINQATAKSFTFTLAILLICVGIAFFAWSSQCKPTGQKVVFDPKPSFVLVEQLNERGYVITNWSVINNSTVVMPGYVKFILSNGTTIVISSPFRVVDKQYE